jgi:hypothetical protein
LILKALEDADAVAEGKRGNLFADLRGSAPDGNVATAGIGDFDGRGGMMKADVQADEHDENEGGSQQNLAYQERRPAIVGTIMDTIMKLIISGGKEKVYNIHEGRCGRR